MLKTPERAMFDGRFATLFAIDPMAIVPENKRHALSIDQVGTGGIIRIGSETFVVDKTAILIETNEKGTKDLDYSVTELVLKSLVTGETRYVEWTIDDEIEVSFTERKLSTAELNRELRDDEGQPFDVDEDIDECAENGWSIRFNGRTYPYDDDYPCRYAASDGRSGEVTIYEFGNDSVGWLTIEAWKNGKTWDYEGYLSSTIQASSIEIFSVGK